MRFLKTLKIIGGNMRSMLLHNIIMMVFTAAAVLMMNVSLARLVYQDYIINLAKDSGLYDTYMYGDVFLHERDTNDPEADKVFNERCRRYFDEQLKNLKTDGVIENYYRLSGLGSMLITEHQNAEGEYDDRVRVRYYSPEFLKDVRFPISKGKWFSEFDFDNSDALPVVIGSELAGRFKIGDHFKFPLQKYDDNDYVVIGVLKRGTRIAPSGTSGSSMGIDMLFEPGDDYMMIGGEEPNSYFSLYDPVLIKTTGGESMNKVFDALEDVSYVFTFAEMEDNYRETQSLVTEMVTTLFLLMIVACVAVVSSGNLLGTISCKKRYAVYFLCGMDWKTGFAASLAECAAKLIIPGAAGCLLAMKLCVTDVIQMDDVTRFGALNVIVTAAMLAAVFLLTSLKPLLDIKRTSPAKIISEM